MFNVSYNSNAGRGIRGIRGKDKRDGGGDEGKGRRKRTHAGDCPAVEDTESILRNAGGLGWEVRGGGGGEVAREERRGEENRRTVCSFRISSSKLTRPGLAAVMRS